MGPATSLAMWPQAVALGASVFLSSLWEEQTVATLRHAGWVNELMYIHGNRGLGAEAKASPIMEIMTI